MTADAARMLPRPIRVCLVGPSRDILGGQAIQMERLGRRLASTPGVEVSFIAVNPVLPGPLRLLQRIRYVRTVATSVAYVGTLLVRLVRADVVHAFSASYWSFLLAPVPAMAVGRLYGKAVVLNYRSGEAEDHLTHWTSARWLARLAHAIVVPSGYLVDVFRRYGLVADAIVNFVENDLIVPRPRGGGALSPRFLANRNLEPLYNVACVLRSFAVIQRSRPDAELVIAGDGRERAALERLSRDLKLRNVTFLGRVPPEAMPALYAAADVYLNAPDIDNMPNSVIEAFAAGLPVVTTNAGGIPWIVRHEENGLMVERDDAEAMSRESLRLLADPDLAARLSATGLADAATRYTWTVVRDEWTGLYRRLTAPGLAADANPASHGGLSGA